MTLYPVQTVAELSSDAQLQQRGFWEEVPHPELGASIRYPRLPAPYPENMAVPGRRAPFLGEHNQEIYQGELGYSRDDLTRLKAAGAI